MRIIYSYCLRYSQPAFYAVVALINPINPSFIVDMRITPADNTEISQPTKFTIIGIFRDGHIANITLNCQILKNNDNLKILADVIVPQKTGECKLSITYGTVTKIITYKVKVAA